jgi:hydrogenase maturation protein HypF
MMAAVSATRRVYRVRGTVQGVGFRPFVYRTAVKLGLRGRVWNDSDGVVIEAEGSPSDLDAFALRLAGHPPPRAHVERIEVVEEAARGAGPFTIVESDALPPVSARVSPDLATCAACLAEMDDPRDRRAGYPFVNCTDCGPRYSIVEDVPYDRARTTMSSFVLCGPCREEFEDPLSRRFHAQPNACPSCGPRISVEGGGEGDPLERAVSALRRGEIVAVKGLAGFHLACDAADSAAVGRLRERKRRPHKPFAVMFPDLDSLESEAVVDAEARASLLGVRRPIVLLPRREGGRLPRELAPGLDELGAFLPYTPLHHLLLRSFGGPLVMTSGNLTEEPIAGSNEEARRRLAGIADVFLVHDRDIHMRGDDSVVRVVGGRERVLRRARGHVPEAISLGFEGPPLLAVGADLKNTLCLTAGGAAILSQHVGDLESYEAQQFFGEVRANLERLFRVRPQLVAHDLHPGYHSTALARRTGLPLEGVQHHHAHVASCLVDNGRRGPVIGVAWDGTGYGTDGSVWGGEILIADLSRFDRVGALRTVALPGGDAAVREPWRMAVSHLMAAGLPLAGVGHPGRDTVEAMVRDRVNVLSTSSAGRLFDAVASLAGIRHATTYEGQAAVELEAISRIDGAEPYPLPVTGDGFFEIDPRPLVGAVVKDVEGGLSAAMVGGRFHRALARSIVEVCRSVRDKSGLDTVALSGGCFQSRLLSLLTEEGLVRAGFEVLQHARVPPNDGGIALGQAAVAGWRYISRGTR